MVGGSTFIKNSIEGASFLWSDAFSDFYRYGRGHKTIPSVHNFMVEWLALLLHIREVPSSALDPKTGYLYL